MDGALPRNSSANVAISPLCIDQLVHAQAEQTPMAVAVEYQQTQLTYAELQSRARALAQRLTLNTDGASDVIAVMLERSPQMVVALLGILSAGRAYLPLDATYPRERLKYMINQSGAVGLVTDRAHAEVAASLGCECIYIDDVAQLGVDERKRWQPPRSPLELAYVMFTSGSTGEPKGVLVPHQGVVNRLLWMRDSFRVDAADRFLHKTPLGFDVSVWEIFVPLISGARAVLARPGGHADAAYLGQLIAEKRISIAHFVPSMLRAFLENAPGGLATPHLKHVVCSGEAITPRLVQDFFAASSAELYNHYGPTEASIEVTSWRCRRDDIGSTVPIGFPIPNVFVEIIDADGRAVSGGELGELYLGGICLARGYAGREDLTDAAFPHVRTSSGELCRMYRSGDLARRNTEGAIEFVGRRDSQVKIRGYRVELGEIEAHLERHPSVQCGLAAVLPEVEGRLVCFVAPRAAAVISIPQLRQHCETYLPQYMWPAEFLVVGSFPLTSSGKVDRRAFLASVAATTDAHAETSARNLELLVTNTEREVAAVWSEFTETESIGRHDNFFWIGGSSLLLVQVLSELSWKFSVDLDLMGMMDHLTVSSLASHIDYQIANQRETDFPQSPGAFARHYPIPLSITQERIWLLDQMGVVGSAFVMPAAFRIVGPVQVEAMVRAIRDIVRRHEILRTRFISAGKEPHQQIDRGDMFEVELVDLATMPEDGREAWLQNRLDAEATTVMSLSSGPLFRVAIVSCSSTEHVLLLTMHHIISDGWSLMGIFPRELGLLYRAYASGQAPALRELPCQYAEYACWQRAWLDAVPAQKELDYWRNALRGAPVALDVPTDRMRAARSTFRGASLRFELPADLSQHIVALAKQEQATTFMVLLAAYQMVLSRWSGQEDFLVGSTSAGRWNRDVEPLIGCFVTTLIFRADLSGDPGFVQLLRRVRRVVLEGFAHRYVPLEQLTAELQPERDLSRQPLFQFAITLHNAPMARLDLPEFEVTPLLVEGHTSKSDMSLHFFDTPRGLVGYFEYSTDLFEPATIARFLAHLQATLHNVVAGPTRSLSEISSLPPSEIATLLSPLPRVGAAEEMQDASLVEIFERRVVLQPDAVAVSDQHCELSYSFLDERANGIAHMIGECCRKPQSSIGLLFGHGHEMIEAILGVLKSGDAYVPLDPAQPISRLAEILADCDCEALLTTGKFGALAREVAGERKVLDISTARGMPAAAVRAPRSAASIAYMLYTSGSTGKPKGVYQNDRNVAHFSRAYCASLGIRARDRLTLLPSYAFDAAVMDIFAALLSGASLHVFDVRTRPVAEMHAWLKTSGITLWHSTPTLLRLASQSFPAGDLPAVRYVVLGGEQAMPADVATVRKVFGQYCVLVNGYGPTESTVTTQYFAAREADAHGARLPIGHSVAGASLFLMDEQGRETELRGELCIAGPHLALGYWNDLDMTAARFCASADRGRYYRTGDIVRRLADGAFEYVGRTDGQLKVRGYRIELGEIEAALRMHPDVVAAVAAALEGPAGNPRIVAAVVRSSGSSEIKDLLAFLKSRLPAYMLPASLAVADQLPLLANGKIDRARLQQLHRPAPTPQENAVPATETERRLKEIWATILPDTAIGVHQDFFELGGDSLTAMWMFANIRDALNVELTLVDLFEAPTIVELAVRVESAMRASERLEVM